MKKHLLLILTLIILLTASSCDATISNEPSKTEYGTTNNTNTDIEVIYQAEDNKFYETIKNIVSTHENLSLAIPESNCESVRILKYGGVMHFSGKATVYINNSAGYPFSEIVSETKINPVHAFNLLVKNGLFYKSDSDDRQIKKDGLLFSFESNYDDNLFLNCSLFELTPKEYTYTYEGCEAFIRELIVMNKTNEDNIDVFNIYENSNSNYIPEIHYSAEDNCYYTYLMQYNGSYSITIALYLRSNNNKTITDVSYQLMRITAPHGDCVMGYGMSMGYIEEEFMFEVISLIASIEKLLTGESYFEKINLPLSHAQQTYLIPYEYTVGNAYKATIEKTNFQGTYYKDHSHTGDGPDLFIMNDYPAEIGPADHCTIYSYRISK